MLRRNQKRIMGLLATFALVLAWGIGETAYAAPNVGDTESSTAEAENNTGGQQDPSASPDTSASISQSESSSPSETVTSRQSQDSEEEADASEEQFSVISGSFLRQGMRSEAVLDLQKTLVGKFKECGSFKPDGIFGGKTKASLNCTQRKLGISRPDGVYGFLTASKFREQGIRAAIASPINTNFNLVPRQNTPYVQSLQGYLAAFYPEHCVIQWVDTFFGGLTSKCVSDIRGDLGLSHSNIVDKAFADAVRKDRGVPITISAAPSPSQQWWRANVWSGSRGSFTRNLQLGLNKYFPQYLGVPADSIFGARTTAAVKAFQRDHGIYPDGGVGMTTAKALRAAGIPVWIIPSVNLISVMGYGSSGYKVEVLQTALTYLNPSYCKFTPDRWFGRMTENCVKTFQRANGIYPDGKVGYSTVRALRAKGMYFNYVGSGDAQLDATLESIVGRYDSLYKSYAYVVNNYRYIGAHGKSHPWGSNWDIQYAKNFFANGGGNCYSFAAGYKWIARALGYPSARVRLGYVANARAPHGWNEIDVSGTTYIFDTDEDMAYKRSKGGWAFYYKTYWNAPIYYWDAYKRRLN